MKRLIISILIFVMAAHLYAGVIGGFKLFTGGVLPVETPGQGNIRLTTGAGLEFSHSKLRFLAVEATVYYTDKTWSRGYLEKVPELCGSVAIRLRTKGRWSIFFGYEVGVLLDRTEHWYAKYDNGYLIGAGKGFTMLSHGMFIDVGYRFPGSHIGSYRSEYQMGVMYLRIGMFI